MSDIKPLSGKDLQVKPFLTQARKIGGRVIHESLSAPVDTDEDGLDNLLADITQEEIITGRERLYRENPHLASEQMVDILNVQASAGDDLAAHLMNPVRLAASKRIGKLADKETGETINFRRNGSSSVELSDDNGQVLETLSSLEFDKVLNTNQFTVL